MSVGPPGAGGLREPETPLVTQCLARVTGVISDGQRGSTVKAVGSLERCCPIMSVAPALAIVCMVAACPCKRESTTPLERLCNFR
jgi:hypothetical protein